MATLLLGVLVLCLALACAPSSAYAGTYEVPSVNIQAQVAENGDLYVTEARTFEFADDINGVFWNIPEAKNQQGAYSSLAITDVWVNDAVPEGEVSEAELRRGARPMQGVPHAEAGVSDMYTVEQADNGQTLKVFMPHEDGDTAVVWVSYVMSGAVMAWPDTAELYWQYVGDEWEEDAENVTLTVTFAGAAAGTPATTGNDAATLRAWGHGPLDGSVSLDVEDPAVPTVTLTAPKVRAGQFAEVRVAFPANWAPHLSPAGEPRLEAILAEEASWAEQANAQREQARVTATVGTAVLTAGPAALLAAAVALRKKYQSPKAVFEETYFRDIPSDDHPAVLSALVYNGTVQDCAFIATLMKLTDDRVIEIRHETRTEDRFLGFGEKEVDAYSLKLVALERATDPIDRLALELYFGLDAQNGDEVEFEAFSEDSETGKSVAESLEDFKAEITSTLERRNLTDLLPMGFKVTMGFAAVLFAVAGFFFLLFTDGVNLVPVLAGIALSIGAVVVASTTKQYSQESVELRNRCAALERWLEDFTNLGEAVPSDLILWNKMLVLGVAFGVSEEVIRQLADAVPEELRVNESGGYYYPSYWWYYSHGRLRSPMSEMHDVYFATVNELASSSDSSAGGFGGGFSGGGGGGVGGGGGGTF